MKKEGIKEALEFRYACKTFSDKKITKENLDLILESARMAPSSYGLEPWNIIVANSNDLRNKVKETAPYNGPRLEASDLLIFTAKTAKGLDVHIDHMLQKRGLKGEQLVKVKESWQNWAKKEFNLKTASDFHHWCARQVYIALGFLMLVAAEMKIDSCPMEGFNVNKLTGILDQEGIINKEMDLPVVMVALGYREETQPEHHRREMSEIIKQY